MREEVFDNIVQRVLGFLMVALPIVLLKAGMFYEPTINSNDGTFLLLVVPMGLYMMFTKHNYIYEDKIES